jgi:hypothetical protein
LLDDFDTNKGLTGADPELIRSMKKRPSGSEQLAISGQFQRQPNPSTPHQKTV